MKKYLIIILLLSLFLGCDSQSPTARYISDLNVELWYDSRATDHPKRLDSWNVELLPKGQDIFGCNFGYVVKVTTFDGIKDVPVAGVRVDCYVEHCDPTGAQYDIWAATTAGGKRFGYVGGIPPNNATWDFDKGHATAKTNSRGQVAFFIGLGCPKNERECYDWEWPRGCSIMVSTGVKVTFVVRKWNSPVEQESHVYFLRLQCADFWLPEDYGVYHQSYSSISPPPSMWGLFDMGEKDNQEAMMDVNAQNMRVGPPNSYPVLRDKNDNIMALNADESIIYLEDEEWWAQLIYTIDCTWVWADFSILKVLVSPDPNLENDAESILSTCEPYVFFCHLIAERPGPYPAEYTVILKSMNENGELVSWQPIKMSIFENVGCKFRMASEYIVPIDSPVGEGRYFDCAGFPGTLIQVVENGYLEVERDSFYGDFNFDGSVNAVDFGLFVGNWYSDVNDVNYDLMYDATQDGRTTENDLAVFVDNWLKERPE